MDIIRIRNLEVFAKHGAYPEENVLGQKFLVTLDMHTSTRKAGVKDDLSESIHYGELCHFVKQFLEAHVYKLIETVAEQLAMELLLEFYGLEKVRLVIAKPWAPIGLPLETVEVEIERGWHTAYIALGSNLGDKEAYLRQAVLDLKQIRGCSVTEVSSFILTAPYGNVEQEDFLNGCLELRTLLMPEELLEHLQEIEQNAGRNRTIHWGPRTLDLDLLLYDDWILDTADLQIPHGEMHKREFVLKPLAEIAPHLRHPVRNRTVAELLERLER